ncbi:MAG: HAD-IC family P-type ATPase, partial [Propionicimonas sp.]|nr:HAD-IC family P-type ATPase [Propionicimonas sp.]
ALAAAVEQHSEHPVAAALVAAAQARGIEPAAADEVTALPGHGVRGLVGPGDGSRAQVEPGDGSRAREVVIGSLDLMETRGLIVPTSARAAVAAAAEAGRTAVLLAIGPAALQTVGSAAPRTVEPSASPPVGPSAPSLVEPSAPSLVKPAASPLVEPLATRSFPLAEPRALPPVEPTGARPAELVGAFEISDVLKDSAPDAVARLRELGLHTVLLTGDRQGPAELIGQQVGVDEVIAEVLPAEKAAAVGHLQQQGRRVAMVGDGINDAAALATANLGMAVVSGTDVAMKSADIILVRRSLDVIPDAIGLARRTLRTIRGNLVWAFGYNVAAIPLAALGYLNPLIAGLAMSLSSIFVVTNSMRLRRFTPPRP